MSFVVSSRSPGDDIHWGFFTYRQNTLQQGGNLTSETQNAIETYMALFPAAADSLGDRGFTPAQIQIAGYIMTLSSDFLQQILDSHYVTELELKQFSTKVVTPVNYLISGMTHTTSL